MPATDHLRLLLFAVGGRHLAIPTSCVEAVVAAVAIVPLPKAPPIVEGVINVRGTLVPVLDVRRRFDLPPLALGLDQHFVIARAGPRLVALRVDRALDVTTVDQRAVEAAAGVVPQVEYVAGIAKLPDGLLVIHDLERFLSLEEGTGVDAAVTEAAPRRGGSRKTP